MSGYDPEKDKLIWSVSLDGDKKSKIFLSIHQYGDAQPKLGLAKKFFTREGEEKFKKLGRLTKEEVEKILGVLPTVIEKL